MAQLVQFGEDGSNIAFEWGDGPAVILVHGWGGQAAQMAPLAAAVAGLGYRCIAPDITGHGDAIQRTTRWSYFLRDIEALAQSLDCAVHAYVGHSAGGLTMMAVRRHGRISARRYVCICAPSYPFPPVRRVQELLNPREGVMERYKSYLGREFEIPWEALQGGASFAGAGEDLLLIYDQRDRFVPHSEGNRINALCPGSTLIKTTEYGHQRILAAPELPKLVGDFIARGKTRERIREVS